MRGAFFIIGSLLLATMVLASNDTLAMEEEEVEEAGEGEGLMLGEVEGEPEQQEEVGDEDEDEEDMQLVNLEDNIVDTGRRRGETLDSSFHHSCDSFSLVPLISQI